MNYESASDDDNLSHLDGNCYGSDLLSFNDTDGDLYDSGGEDEPVEHDQGGW